LVPWKGSARLGKIRLSGAVNLEAIDFLRAVRAYQQRQRRFGR